MWIICFILYVGIHFVESQGQWRPRNCLEIRDSQDNVGSGQYVIYPRVNPMSVWCDMVSGGGGWTVFHRRFYGSVDFYLNWHAYKRGFGNIDGGEYWLGNDNIHDLTQSGQMELRVDLEAESDTAFAEFSSFSVADESNNYRLSVSGYKPHSTAGDSITRTNGKPFSTFDRDNDDLPDNCATEYFGGWWYDYCHLANLNGRYEYTAANKGVVTTYATSMCYRTYKTYYYSMKAASMKVRPKVGDGCVVQEDESFPYGPCSVTCGQGRKSRIYFCTFLNNGTRRFIKDDVLCYPGIPCENL